MEILGEDDEATNYFMDILPKIKQTYPDLMKYIIEFTQYPGDTVYVPGGWWHAVINLDNTIAITQNFCSSSNFDNVWCKTRKSRKKMSVKWLKRLEIASQDNPHLLSLLYRALYLNERDNFKMFEMLTDKFNLNESTISNYKQLNCDVNIDNNANNTNDHEAIFTGAAATNKEEKKRENVIMKMLQIIKKPKFKIFLILIVYKITINK